MWLRAAPGPRIRLTPVKGNNCIFVGEGNDVVTVGQGQNLIVLGGGNDSATTGEGNDVLWGGLQPTQPNDDNDVLTGEGGRDQLDGGTGSNIMDAVADNIRETVIGLGGVDTAYIHENEGKNQDVLKNHSKREKIIAFGSILVSAAPATPTDCDSPVVVAVPNPLSGGAARRHTTKRDVPKGRRKFRRK